MAISAVAESTRGRRVTVLGATGSIGRSTLDLVARNRDSYELEAITAHSNVDSLVEQALRLRPRLAAIGDDSLYPRLKDGLNGSGIQTASGDAGLREAAEMPADWVMAGIVGAAGLEPTLAAVRRGAVVALANKECLVCAGEFMLGEAARTGATLLPVDSEHNAIFQVFDFDHPERIEKIILTASGGPFRESDIETMRAATPEQAVAHPNWSMGAKISVDSATMMNKGLELIEAFHLFPLRSDQIEVLVHPQSVIHSMVGYCDGSVLAQLGTPDMRTPIAHTLAWPDRIDAPVERLDLAAIGKLTFEKPDESRFPALRVARAALAAGGQAPIVLNAANEEAVRAFLGGRIGFLDIAETVERTIAAVPAARVAGIDDVGAIDRDARRVARDLIAAV